MRYLLDTNVCIRYMNGRSPNISQRLQRVSPDDIAVCSVVKLELFYGAWRSQNPQKTLVKQQRFLHPYNSLPLDDQAAAVAGRLRGQLAQLGTPIGPYDLLIAAIALTNNLTLVTNNLKEFSRVTHLQLENWES